MSDFSDFFPAAGGGGGIGQTITVGDISYPNARPLAEMAETRICEFGSDGSSLRASGPSGSSTYNYSATIPTSSAYVTVADVTGAANGGTPVEIIFSPQAGTLRSYAFAMGCYETLSVSSTRGSTTNTFYGANNNNLVGSWSSDNNFYGSAGANGFINTNLNMLDPLMSLYRGMPYVYFTTSCKVEVKQTATNYQGSLAFTAIFTF